MYLCAVKRQDRNVAQLVAHYVRDVGVGRSSRLIPTKKGNLMAPFFYWNEATIPYFSLLRKRGHFVPLAALRVRVLVPSIHSPQYNCTCVSIFDSLFCRNDAKLPFSLLRIYLISSAVFNQ